ncbi:MAG: 2,3-bisphosphoglycerate-dependent phosphoglycerate mutase [Gammaproteobacteria bacterium]|nr:2,3-bisphosphoglycerate-dependent phosphoglycerate mutase [Gammaproteobacteria bacterium]|tara:strand:+ start:1945 stop:2568 length:624 start_codon:yes stop_codon:yes gene_type:complete
MKKRNLILVRHGQSEWNAKDLFTGWENPGLTKEGYLEAERAGKLIKELGIKVDFLFTSALARAQITGEIILDTIEQANIPIKKDQALNERFYGNLQGLNKQDCRNKWGNKKVQMWRRSYDMAPPGGESLKQTGERVIPYFENEMLPLLLDGMNVLVAAHGNSLRVLIKSLDCISDKDITHLEIPTGSPIHYTFNAEGLVINKKNLIK